MSSIQIDEILAYAPPDKRLRLGVDVGNGTADTPTDEDILKALEAAEEEPPLDDTGVRKLVLNLEKKALKNQEMRVKHPDDPSKFMDTEVELNTAIQEMFAIATAPDLYPLLVRLNCCQTMMQLLVHENSDIAVATIHLLQELTDVDTLEESEEGATALVDGLVKSAVVSVLVQSIDRLDETNKDESDGVHNALAIVENIVDFRPEVCKVAAEQNLLGWLVRRIRQKGVFDGNKLYASEMLGVVLQQSEESRKALGERDGIDVLLQCLAAYKRHNPTSNDEREHMENLFDCLCAALMHTPNRQRFLDGEGLQLMNLMLRERKESRFSALKVLDYATTGPEGKDNCNKFVDILGLRTLFPLFMKTPSKKKRKDRSAFEHEEHVCAVVASLLRSSNQTNRGRLLQKFTEHDHAKVDRLVELHFRYADRVKLFEVSAAVSDPEADNDELYLRKLDSGLFTMQLVDLIIIDVCVNGQKSVDEKVTKLLSMKNSGKAAVRTVVKEYRDNLGEDAGVERERVAKLLAGYN